MAVGGRSVGQSRSTHYLLLCIAFYRTTSTFCLRSSCDHGPCYVMMNGFRWKLCNATLISNPYGSCMLPVRVVQQLLFSGRLTPMKKNRRKNTAVKHWYQKWSSMQRRSRFSLRYPSTAAFFRRRAPLHKEQLIRGAIVNRTKYC